VAVGLHQLAVGGTGAREPAGAVAHVLAEAGEPAGQLGVGGVGASHVAVGELTGGGHVRRPVGGERRQPLVPPERVQPARLPLGVQTLEHIAREIEALGVAAVLVGMRRQRPQQP
jgi:hypothetical protein